MNFELWRGRTLFRKDSGGLMLLPSISLLWFKRHADNPPWKITLVFGWLRWSFCVALCGEFLPECVKGPILLGPSSLKAPND